MSDKKENFLFNNKKSKKKVIGMTNIFVFTQNLVLKSISKYAYLSNKKDDKTIFITTHYLFENERQFLRQYFNSCEFKTFADFLTDEEMAKCDVESFESKDMDYQSYLDNIRKNKNKLVVLKVIEKYTPDGKYILCDDLGIDYVTWKNEKFKFISGEYYYIENKITPKEKIRKKLSRISFLKQLHNKVRPGKKHTPDEVFVGYYNNKKYLFIGNMNRIGYRFDIKFTNSEEECTKLNNKEYETLDKCIYVTTWHEHWKCDIPDDPKYSVKWTQDGYLPPNYSHKDYLFKPNNVTYYCWDVLGTKLFENQKLPYELIPFRKKIYLPKPNFPKKVKSILVVASGSGDWTALKNRSDDDIMVDAIVKMARKFPNIKFTYRCHPTWVHPLNVGVNSINRVHDYFKWLNLSNLNLSGNIPSMKVGDKYKYSFSRSSLEDDLKEADFVIGEHSISMIDAAFKKIPFFSVNLTKRRNFFEGLNELGFPYCSSIEEIENMIGNICSEEFVESFLIAVDNYNKMTDME